VAAAAGVLTAPRCWLRRYCYDEGAFICLQRQAKAAAGGCSSYVYGASDLHIDPLNQCDHGGSHLVAIAAMFTAFAATLLLIWLHHCRWAGGGGVCVGGGGAECEGGGG